MRGQVHRIDSHYRERLSRLFRNHFGEVSCNLPYQATAESAYLLRFQLFWA
jgi:hypothetical protein